MNQTSQMHQISQHLPEYDCYFSQFYSHNWILKWATKVGLMDNTIMAGHFQKDADDYLRSHGLKNDHRMEKYNNKYDLAIICNDLIFPRDLKNLKTVYVQEGMTDPVTWWTKAVKFLKLPRYLAMGTSLNGASNLCDIYCCASEGYKNHLTNMGTDKDKITVTGIPNYDNCAKYLDNNFPHKGYVMVATTDMRETLRKENRVEFIKNCVKIADGRQLLFKLHPNEIVDRAVAEIKANAPANSLIFTSGSTDEMIANCDELITQYSTVVYTGIALGKKVHSYFDVDELYRLCPKQNGGTSAKNIADICRQYIEFKGSGKEFLSKLKTKKPKPAFAE